MPTGQQYATNVPQTTLQGGGVSAGSPTCQVQSSVSWPNTPFTAIFNIGESNQEPVDVTNVSGTTWTITRGVDGTTPFAHSNGASVTFGFIGRDMTETRTHIDATTNIHGLSGGAALVGTTTTQTLSNKTLASSTVYAGSGGTLTMPAGPDTLVGIAAVQTLTNKTLTSPIITGASFTDLSVPNSGIGTVPLTVAAISGTTGDLFDVNLNAVKKWSVNSTGNLVAGAGVQLDLSGTSVANPIIGAALQAQAAPFTGTSFSVGNGTQSGVYVQYGKWVFFKAILNIGSTTNLGTGLQLTLPVTPITFVSFTGQYIGLVGTSFPVTALNISSGSATCEVHYHATNQITNIVTNDGTSVTNTTPHAPANTDRLVIMGMYQVA